MRAAPIFALALLLDAPAFAEEAPPTMDSEPQSSSRETPGWREVGLVAPAMRWRAGVATLGAVSDRFGGDDQPGWLLQIAPRLHLERPPARFSGWLAYEPALQARAGLSTNRSDTPSRDGSEAETKIQHQGSAGFAIGDDAGTRGSAQAKRSVTLDQVRSEEVGLVEHVETAAEAALEWISPDRGTLGLRAGGTRVQYPLEGLRAADFDRVKGTLDATARFHLRMSGSVELSATRTTYRHLLDEDGDRREVDTFGAVAFVEAQPLPSLSVRAGAGPVLRRDPDTTLDVPVTAGVTADVRRRYRASLDVGTGLEDSLWRGSRYVRVVHSRARLGAELARRIDLGLFGGLALADYPSREVTGSGEETDRNDLTWGAGAEFSWHPGGQFRTALSVSHMERRSSFPGYAWKENRCVLSAFMDW